MSHLLLGHGEKSTYLRFVNLVSFWLEVSLQFFYNLFRILAFFFGHWLSGNVFIPLLFQFLLVV